MTPPLFLKNMHLFVSVGSCELCRCFVSDFRFAVHKQRDMIPFDADDG